MEKKYRMTVSEKERQMLLSERRRVADQEDGLRRSAVIRQLERAKAAKAPQPGMKVDA